MSTWSASNGICRPRRPQLPLTLDTWTFGGNRFKVDQFHDDDGGDSWDYELYEIDTDSAANNYIDGRLPDALPESGPFVPMPSDHVALTVHGRWTLPWPVFRRFLDAIQAAGDIVESTGATPALADRP
ncbi:hypothetical protein [Couchioplanes azureus]|uniref:hypothetical protein n=1 Tax=Couchioplanes caeruleus TaxID=56438 RepID=UPI00166FD02B|nr:hypothetical protein [Couchioplanes caeruleus]GGQ43818.1 hypothetical protein GCM10010166_10370 [Couchioplanes caeruleus subsp. azureus]